MKNNKHWGVSQIWNQSLEERDERKTEPRDRIWASELGKAPVDVWLHMKGHEPTNPPNKRSLRKFEAGNIWEWLIILVLKRAGIFKTEQEYVTHQYPGLLLVSGKIDAIAGGKPDLTKFEESLADLELPEIFTKAGKNIVEYINKEYPDGLEEIPIEIKTSSSFMFEKILESGEASINHQLQLFHYLKSKGYEKGILIYICKDDARLHEIVIMNAPHLEKKYKDAIKLLTDYYNKDEMPPKEDPIEFSEEFKTFSKNWRVAYSGYLEKLYGFKNQAEFDEEYGDVGGKWNRVLTRIQEGKDITANNLERLYEIHNAGFDLNDVLKKVLDKAIPAIYKDAINNVKQMDSIISADKKLNPTDVAKDIIKQEKVAAKELAKKNEK